MLDRTKTPASTLPQEVLFPFPTTVSLSPHLPLHVLHSERGSIVRVELVFLTGEAYVDQPCIAVLTAKMLLKGTKRKTAPEVAHYIAQYGAELNAHVGADFFTVQLTVLAAYLSPMLDLLMEILNESIFPEEAFERVRTLKLQRLKVLEERNAYLAQRAFYKLLFGENHPYAYRTNAQNLNSLQCKDLITYYQSNLFAAGHVFLSGWADSSVVKLVQEKLQDVPYLSALRAGRYPEFQQKNHQENIKRDQLQGCFIVGLPIIGPQHPDYLALYFAIELFGGYFGSRLMQNLREKKGYTYGVRAHIHPFIKTHVLEISAEVIREHTEQACQEVFKEIEKLHQEVIPDEEMNTLKNYLLGSFLAHTDHPFALMNHYKKGYLFHLPLNYHEYYYRGIREITAAQVQRAARAYLSSDLFTRIIVN